ncbi:MAG: endonuclease V [Salinirussus sp.]
MRIVRPDFRPDPSLDRDEMKSRQLEIANAAIFEDDLDIDPGSVTADGGSAIVAGVDQGFRGDTAVSAVVAMRAGEVIEQASATKPTELPYIPGLLAFREAPAVLAALMELDCEPDLVVFDGSGRIHYRQAGLATHVAVMLDMPAVGVIKTLLCGTPRESIDPPLPAGARIPIDPDGEVEGPVDGPLGYALQTRQFEGARYVNPVFVSPGHRIGADTATNLVEQLCAGYKLPEPIRLADRAATELAE